MKRMAAALTAIVVCYLAWRGITRQPLLPWRQANHQRQARLQAALDRITLDGFYVSLPKLRQNEVREIALLALNRIEDDRSYRERVGLSQDEKAYDVDGSLLRMNEISFLRRHNLPIEPSWPGYKTFQSRDRVYVLIPESMLARDEDNPNGADHFEPTHE